MSSTPGAGIPVVVVDAARSDTDGGPGSPDSDKRAGFLPQNRQVRLVMRNRVAHCCRRLGGGMQSPLSWRVITPGPTLPSGIARQHQADTISSGQGQAVVPTVASRISNGITSPRSAEHAAPSRESTARFGGNRLVGRSSHREISGVGSRRSARSLSSCCRRASRERFGDEGVTTASAGGRVLGDGCDRRGRGRQMRE